MAVIVSTNETVLPVTKKKLFDYVRFQTRMSNPDLLSDTDLCAIATISEQNEARARKFIQKQATVTWAVTDTDAELPSDFQYKGSMKPFQVTLFQSGSMG
jgi:predicted ATP-binding protein involved in virulence